MRAGKLKLCLKISRSLARVHSALLKCYFVVRYYMAKLSHEDAFEKLEDVCGM